MLPVNYGGHTAYQDTFVSEFLSLFPDPFVVPKQTWDIIVKFWYLDLSETDTIMQEFYPLTGKPATRFPSCLLRSYLLSIVLGVTSITQWCRLLKITPLYAILSGFPADDTPGVGTFYDFFNRLWQSDKNNHINQMKHKKPKPEKGKKRGDKTPCNTDSAAAKLLPLMQRMNLPNNNPFYLIFRLYKAQFLDTSVRKGLINPERLSLAGDGTPLETARLERSKRTCGCPKGSGCGCKRKFSQPDCNWGWDSSMYWSSIFVTLCSRNSLHVPCFKWCHPVVVRMRSDMVVPNKYILCYRIIQCFSIHKMIPIYQFILKCFIKPLHWSIIIRTSCFTHALDNSLGFTKIYKSP